MSTRLRAIARETVEIVDKGGYLTPSGRWVDIAFDRTLTRLHLPDEELPRHGGTTPRIEVVNQTTL
ncbi:hypothetical protein [Herbidospora cretacea]|uniref:hypothetical protein n=1 Tax=Herbidospora cretacea TaxID=28444 RepID=UPI000A89AD62